MIDKRTPDPERAWRRSLVSVIVALTVGTALFRLLVFSSLEHTSLLFIGIPAILAVLTALTPAPRSATGMIVKVITLSLLIAGIVLGEAFVCILFAAPIFFVVGIGIGLLVDFLRARGRRGLDSKSACLLLLALVPASVEGVVPGFGFDRHETVTVARVVAGSGSDVAAALGRTPQFDRSLPAFFKLGFPAPGSAAGSGLAVGDRRLIELVHGRHPGTLELAIRASGPGHVVFAPVRDETYITHWLSWRQANVRWYELAPGQTLVSWTLEYRRRLDPAWYFAPLERYGARLAAGYLIDALATPRAAESPSPAFEGPRYIDVFCRALLLR